MGEGDQICRHQARLKITFRDAGIGGKRRRHGGRLGKIFADLDRRCEFARQSGVARVIVVADRLLEPKDVLAVEHAAAAQRFGGAEQLIIIDHDGDGVAHAFAHRAQRRQVLARGRIAQPQLDGAKAGREQLLRSSAIASGSSIRPRPQLL